MYSPLVSYRTRFSKVFSYIIYLREARRESAEVSGWTFDRKIRVRFPAYPHHRCALWWQGGKRRRRTSRCPRRGRLGTLKTLSCPWRWCPAAGQNLETGHLSRHFIAEISLNVTLNHIQQQQHQQHLREKKYAVKWFNFVIRNYNVHTNFTWIQNNSYVSVYQKSLDSLLRVIKGVNISKFSDVPRHNSCSDWKWNYM